MDKGNHQLRGNCARIDYWKATGGKEIDEGRVLATKNPEDRYVFKVPSLRNVAMTGPYFHDGSVDSLPDAVRAIARLQLGVTAGDKDVRNIVAFLGSLTGTLPENFATAPVLPAERVVVAFNQPARLALVRATAATAREARYAAHTKFD